MAVTLKTSTYDIVIAGAGSAGCVLAARLSEDEKRSVLLLDAGPDYGGNLDNWPPDLVSANTLVASHDWGYKSEPGPLGNSLTLLRGKVVGGSSATNNVIALRGQPSDYDTWAKAGNPGWSFGEILPFFRKLEKDFDFANEWHGGDGPLIIRRPAYNEILPVQSAFFDSARGMGISRSRIITNQGQSV